MSADIDRNSAIADWQSLATYGGQKLPPSFIVDASAIITNLTTKGTGYKLLKIMEEMESHLTEHGDPHAFDVTCLKDPIILELYKEYRHQALAGDRIAMLRALFQMIDIVDWAEAYAGEEDTKAVNVVKAQIQIQQHEQSLQCHFGTLSRFMPLDIIRVRPTIAFHDFFMKKHYYEQFFTENYFIYPVPSNVWNPWMGTIVFAYDYIQKEEQQFFFQCFSDEGITPRLRCLLDKDGYLRLYRYGYTDKEDPNELLYEELTDPIESGHRKLVLSYGNGKICIRTTIGKRTILDLPTDFNIQQVQIYQPFVKMDDTCRTESFVYYPTYTDVDHTLVSLLD